MGLFAPCLGQAGFHRLCLSVTNSPLRQPTGLTPGTTNIDNQITTVTTFNSQHLLGALSISRDAEPLQKEHPPGQRHNVYFATDAVTFGTKRAVQTVLSITLLSVLSKRVLDNKGRPGDDVVAHDACPGEGWVGGWRSPIKGRESLPAYLLE